MPKDIKEIENKKENRHGWFAFSFVIIHFSFIIISMLSPDAIHPKLNAISKQYVTPFFAQKWNMFAPCPILENRFKFKFNFEGETTDWIDPSIITLEKHQRYRLSHHGNLAVGEYNLLYWALLDLEDQNVEPNKKLNFELFPSLKKTRGLFLLKNYLKGYALKYFKQKPLGTEVILTYRNVKNNTVTQYHFTNFK